jgi:hypothetical protein
VKPYRRQRFMCRRDGNRKPGTPIGMCPQCPVTPTGMRQHGTDTPLGMCHPDSRLPDPMYPKIIGGYSRNVCHSIAIVKTTRPNEPKITEGQTERIRRSDRTNPKIAEGRTERSLKVRPNESEDR